MALRGKALHGCCPLATISEYAKIEQGYQKSLRSPEPTLGIDFLLALLCVAPLHGGLSCDKMGCHAERAYIVRHPQCLTERTLVKVCFR